MSCLLHSWLNKIKSYYGSSSVAHEYISVTNFWRALDIFQKDQTDQPTNTPTVSSLQSSHTASLANEKWLFDIELQQFLWHKEMVDLIAKRSKRRVEIVTKEKSSTCRVSLTAVGEVRHEPCQLHWHAVVVLMNRFAVLIATLTFPTTQSHSSYQGPLTPCNHFHLPFPKIHMDRKSSPRQLIQPFVD